jgi:hypothetical protein
MQQVRRPGARWGRLRLDDAVLVRHCLSSTGTPGCQRLAQGPQAFRGIMSRSAGPEAAGRPGRTALIQRVSHPPAGVQTGGTERRHLLVPEPQRRWRPAFVPDRAVRIAGDSAPNRVSCLTANVRLVTPEAAPHGPMPDGIAWGYRLDPRQ